MPPDTPPFKPAVNLWPPMAEAEYTLALREFVEKRVTPQGDDIDARDVYPVELARELAVKGFSSITMPTEYGGGGREFSYAVALFEEVSVGSAALGVSLLTIFQAQTISFACLAARASSGDICRSSPKACSRPMR